MFLEKQFVLELEFFQIGTTYLCCDKKTFSYFFVFITGVKIVLFFRFRRIWDLELLEHSNPNMSNASNESNANPSRLRVVGVPEHFNAVWEKAIEEKLFFDEGIEVEWTTQSLGTGAMCKSLKGFLRPE